MKSWGEKHNWAVETEDPSSPDWESSYDYVYNALGQLDEITDAMTGRDDVVQTFFYDDVGRLKTRGCHCWLVQQCCVG